MATTFQPAPTWAPPILEAVDPATGEKKATFNPVWLQWFVELAVVQSTSGAAGNVVGPRVAVNNHVAVFDGTTGRLIKDGGPAGAAVNFVDAEVPSGFVNGNNVTFTLANAPSPPASLFLYHADGNPYIGNGVHYTLSGVTITFQVAATPQVGDLLYANYRYIG